MLIHQTYCFYFIEMWFYLEFFIDSKQKRLHFQHAYIELQIFSPSELPPTKEKKAYVGKKNLREGLYTQKWPFMNL